MPIKRMTDLNLNGKRVLIREDLNVPVKNGKVTSDIRIRASLPTIRLALEGGAHVLLMSHLGRPTEGQYDEQYSLKPVAAHLGELLDKPVRLDKNWLSSIESRPGEVVLCENVRFNLGEKKNDPDLSQKMANLCDIFVMDAFGTAHRAQASTYGIAKFAPVTCAGPLLANELDALGKALQDPKRPLLAIVGGSKVSTKLTVLESLSNKVDQLIVGGGIANTFIAAAGYPVGKSLYEQDLLPDAKRLAETAKARGAEIPVPTDVVCAKEFSETAQATVKRVDEVTGDDLILDIGPETSARYADMLKSAGTIVWNGPVGVFEIDQFGEGTRSLSLAIAESPAFSIAGGGAFLEFLEGKKLPAVEILEQRYSE